MRRASKGFARVQRTWPAVSVALAAGVWGGCSRDSPAFPSGPELPPQPVLISPVGGVQVSTDTPTFTVQNARGFDAGQAEYTFVVLSRSGTRMIASATVPAGRLTTSLTFASPLPRGGTLLWRVTARGPGSEVSSDSAAFRLPAVACLSSPDPYAKSVVDFFLPACSLERNRYNDPRQVLGPPDAGRGFPGGPFFGFMSLGEKGYVTVDMELCAVDTPGPDVRVFQSVSNEPVTLYASGSAAGPFLLLEARKPCGLPLTGVFSGYCDFDLADAELDEARYFKIEDGELFPCEMGQTDSEGADIDAIQVLHPRP